MKLIRIEEVDKIDNGCVTAGRSNEEIQYLETRKSR